MLSKNCIKCAVSLHSAEHLKERLEDTRPAEPPEPLPYAVPVPEFLRKSPPSDIMNHKIVQGFEKLSVVAALVAWQARVRSQGYSRTEFDCRKLFEA